LLEGRLFYIPSFKIYGGVAGLYDYGPPGCAVKANVQQFWRQHFVLEESMLEVECPAVTPESVLRASGVSIGCMEVDSRTLFFSRAAAFSPPV
jgi:glycyl-tRNA synthetase